MLSKLLILFFTLTLVACASIPEPKQPRGTKVPINKFLG